MATCPACGVASRDDHDAFTVVPIFVTQKIGEFSLAGQTPQLVAVQRWKLACRCGWSILGHLEGNDFYGDPATQIWP